MRAGAASRPRRRRSPPAPAADQPVTKLFLLDFAAF